MKNNNLIAINGKINSGKDTVGSIILYLIATKDRKPYDYPYTYQEYLDRRLGNEIAGWKIKKFADKLKDIVCLLIGCTREQLEDREFKEKELGEEWKVYMIDYQTSYDGIDHDHSKIFLNEESAIDWYEPLYIRPLRGRYIKLTPRKLLQLLGTECGREIIHPNIWVNSLFANYKQIVGYAPGNYWCRCGNCKKEFTGDKRAVRCEECSIFYHKWIITDMRFPNEMKAVKDRGGITIRVQRPEYCPNCPMKDLTSQDCGDCAIYQDEIYQGLHESETALDNAKFDYTIDNNGTIEDLIRAVKQILIIEKVI